MTPFNPLAQRQPSSSARPIFQNNGSPVPWNLKLDGQPPDLTIPEKVEIGMPVPGVSSIRGFLGPSEGMSRVAQSWEPCISSLLLVLVTETTAQLSRCNKIDNVRLGFVTSD
jgi:hypothetical protein